MFKMPLIPSQQLKIKPQRHSRFDFYYKHYIFINISFLSLKYIYMHMVERGLAPFLFLHYAFLKLSSMIRIVLHSLVSFMSTAFQRSSPSSSTHRAIVFVFHAYTVCPTNYRTRHFFNTSNTNEDIATKFEHGYVRCVRNEKECVCSLCLQCVSVVCPILATRSNGPAASQLGSQWDTLYFMLYRNFLSLSVLRSCYN